MYYNKFLHKRANVLDDIKDAWNDLSDNDKRALLMTGAGTTLGGVGSLALGDKDRDTKQKVLDALLYGGLTGAGTYGLSRLTEPEELSWGQKAFNSLPPAMQAQVAAMAAELNVSAQSIMNTLAGRGNELMTGAANALSSNIKEGTNKANDFIKDGGLERWAVKGAKKGSEWVRDKISKAKNELNPNSTEPTV